MTIRDPQLEALTRKQADLFNADVPEDQRIRIHEEIKRVQEQQQERE
jgi:hypothetical protein